MSVTCRVCRRELGSKAELVAHWQEEREKDNKHYHCQECKTLFHTREAENRHHREFHREKQDIRCPGCDTQFVAAGGLVDHIEKNRCKTIGNDTLAARREEKLAFARELQARHFGSQPDLPGDDLSVASLSLAETTVSRQGPYNFAKYLSTVRDVPASTPSLSALRPKADTTVRPNPITFATKDASFPPLAGRQPNHPTTGRTGMTNTEKGGPWAQKRDLFPGSTPAVRPTAEKLQELQTPAPNKDTAWPPHDPRNPRWNADDYFVQYTNKYRCPGERCPKSFASGAGLRTHLLATHAGQMKQMQCPRCCRWFPGMAALTQHAESQGVRCTIRETDGYRQFLDQLTAGIVDTTEKNADGTEKYSVPAEAREVFGTWQRHDTWGKPAGKGEGKEEKKEEKKEEETWEEGFW